MRKIIAISQVTVDGVMQGPGTPEEDPSGGFTKGGWAMPFVDDALQRVIADTMSEDADLLLGRRTYQIFERFWPKQGPNVVVNAFNRATKYVVTRSLDQLEWKPSQKIGGDVVSELRRLKASGGEPLHIWGSSELLQTLIASDLIDEYRLWIVPVVMGAGKRLFEKGVPAHDLKLVATQRMPSGVLVNTYRPARASTVA
jgi:dihydrofolate reductase